MRKPRIGECIFPAETPGPVGFNDQADPNVLSELGETGGPLGFRDYAEYLAFAPPLTVTEETPETPSGDEILSDEPVSGAVPGGVGMASVVRIPVPGSGGLHIELTPRGRVPPGGSTSTLFIQDRAGGRQLRLDYGYNKKTGKIDYHWNQKGTHDVFEIKDHTPAGRGGQALYKGAKYFRYAGRVLLVVGAASDLYSIVVTKKRWRRVTQVAAGWAGAWAGCKGVGAGGAALGSAVPGIGTAVGGIGGCIGGGIGGYYLAEQAAGEIYDWVEETYFEYLPEIDAPPDM